MCVWKYVFRIALARFASCGRSPKLSPSHAATSPSSPPGGRTVWLAPPPLTPLLLPALCQFSSLIIAPKPLAPGRLW